jgi:hypothetical protein
MSMSMIHCHKIVSHKVQIFSAKVDPLQQTVIKFEASQTENIFTQEKSP